MSITVKGSIERKNIGVGTWALVTEEGEIYELRKAPKDLRQSGLKAEVTGTVQEDVMTVAAIGPVLEVQSFAVSD